MFDSIDVMWKYNAYTGVYSSGKTGWVGVFRLFFLHKNDKERKGITGVLIKTLEKNNMS